MAKGAVCKTVSCGFNSHPRLHFFALISGFSRFYGLIIRKNELFFVLPLDNLTSM